MTTLPWLFLSGNSAVCIYKQSNICDLCCISINKTGLEFWNLSKKVSFKTLDLGTRSLHNFYLHLSLIIMRSIMYVAQKIMLGLPLATTLNLSRVSLICFSRYTHWEIFWWEVTLLCTKATLVLKFTWYLILLACQVKAFLMSSVLIASVY